MRNECEVGLYPFLENILSMIYVFELFVLSLDDQLFFFDAGEQILLLLFFHFYKGMTIYLYYTQYHRN